MINGAANRWADTRFHPVSTDLLDVMADEGRPMTVGEMAEGLEPVQASFELSVARVAGFVRAVPGGGPEQRYAPTALGYAIARRGRAFAAAQDERTRAAA